MKLISIFIFFILYCFVGCTPNSKESKEDGLLPKDSVRIALTYPVGIDSAHLQLLYDDARWTLYTNTCDSPYQAKDDSDVQVARSIGLLRIEFDTLRRKSDTIEFYFKYMDGNKVISLTSLRHHVSLKNGVGYKYATGEKLYLMSSSNYVIQERGIASRFVDPLQSEVVKYIESNWNILPLDFRLLAQKRGLSPCGSR